MRSANTAGYGSPPRANMPSGQSIPSSQRASRAPTSWVLLPNTDSTRGCAHTTTPEGTTAGVTMGGVVGGTLGVLAGVGALAIPGIGPSIAAGPIVAGLAKLGAGRCARRLGGRAGRHDIPEYAAKRYEGHVRDGGSLMSIHLRYGRRSGSRREGRGYPCRIRNSFRAPSVRLENDSRLRGGSFLT